jgi:hypothetical protein
MKKFAKKNNIVLGEGSKNATFFSWNFDAVFYSYVFFFDYDPVFLVKISFKLVIS